MGHRCDCRLVLFQALAESVKGACLGAGPGCRPVRGGGAWLRGDSRPLFVHLASASVSRPHTVCDVAQHEPQVWPGVCGERLALVVQCLHQGCGLLQAVPWRFVLPKNHLITYGENEWDTFFCQTEQRVPCKKEMVHPTSGCVSKW